MAQIDSTAGTGSGTGRGHGGGATKPRRGLFDQYKAEQGKTTRVGSFVGAAVLVAWGAKFLYDRLAIYQGDEAWRLLVTNGIPVAFAVVFGAAVWWLIFAHRGAGDFMIATEGEMKKVNWTTRREIIGSTKVVIVFTVFMAVFLFTVDIVLQQLFSWLGVLKT